MDSALAAYSCGGSFGIIGPETGDAPNSLLALDLAIRETVTQYLVDRS